jgi:hypothetical protein
MFDIGFGLLLYRILNWFLVFFVVMLLIPFFMNMADGKGYGYNFKLVWGGLWKFITFGIRKRD